MTKTKSKPLQRLLILLAVLFFTASGILSWVLYDALVDRSGWELEDGVYFYRDFHHRRVSGWQQIEGNLYYFDPAAGMQTGWLTQDSQVRYLHSDGTMATGWQELEGNRYHFDSTGLLSTGWLEDGGTRYYLQEDGLPGTGWLETEDGRYYLRQDGSVTVGPVSIGEASYCFSREGRMLTGWQDGLYYLPDGTMASGWQDIDGKRYFFEADGRPHTGWLTQGEYSYYFLEDGAAAVGPQIIDGQEHFFTPKGIHVVLVNADHPIPDYWKPEIVTLFGWNRVARSCLEPMQEMLAACEAAGHKYDFNSSYRSHENQVEIVKIRTQEYMDAGMSYQQAYAKTLESAALPGTSEHALGLAADITGEDAKLWLGQHCWEYGFILRYPPDKQHITGIMNEPWHFRYVGTEVSMDMKDSGLCLEEYLGAGPVGG